MKRCPTCGKEYADPYRFCQDDATPLARLPESHDVAAPAVPPAGAATMPARAATRGAGATRRTLLVAAAALVTAIGIGTAAAVRARQPATGPSLAAAQRHARDTAWKTYENPALGFRLDYPAGWAEPALQQTEGGGMRVQWSAPTEPNVGILVDVFPYPPGITTPRQNWQDLDRRFTRAFKERYRRLSLQDSRLGGREAATWVLTVQRKGTPHLKKVDIGATHRGQGVALLLSAPVEEFAAWQSAFDHVAESFAWTDGDADD